MGFLGSPSLHHFILHLKHSHKSTKARESNEPTCTCSKPPDGRREITAQFKLVVIRNSDFPSLSVFHDWGPEWYLKKRFALLPEGHQSVDLNGVAAAERRDCEGLRHRLEHRLPDHCKGGGIRQEVNIACFEHRHRKPGKWGAGMPPISNTSQPSDLAPGVKILAGYSEEGKRCRTFI